VESHISATNASRGFADVLNRVEYGGETFVVERAGKPICKIIPLPRHLTGAEQAALWAKRPKVDAGWCADVEWAIKNQGELPKIDW